MRLPARLLAVAAVTLLAPLISSALAPAPAQASGPCRGHVLRWWKADNIVRMTYRINCTRKVDRIQLKAFLREGDRWSLQNPITCRNTTHCVKTEILRDRAGLQWYAGRAFEGFSPPDTYVQDNGNNWSCNTPGATGMPCSGGSKQY